MPTRRLEAVLRFPRRMQGDTGKENRGRGANSPSFVFHDAGTGRG